MTRTIIALFCCMALTAHAQQRMEIHITNGPVLTIPIATIDSVTYASGQAGSLGVVHTYLVEDIDSVSAKVRGTVQGPTDMAYIYSKGICWSTNPIPTTSNQTVIVGNGAGSFTGTLGGLEPSTVYYVRAFAINAIGLTYGEILSFITYPIGDIHLPGAGVTDVAGNTYTSVILGTQEWMGENLRTQLYANGDTIPNVITNSLWANLTTGAWAYMGHNPIYNVPFGKHYNWFTVADARGLCPTGWHVPVNAEWQTLATYLGGTLQAGRKMKSVVDWVDGGGGTNMSNLNARPAQTRHEFGAIATASGYHTYWWTGEPSQDSGAPCWYLAHWGDELVDSGMYKQAGLSVRCVKD